MSEADGVVEWRQMQCSAKFSDEVVADLPKFVVDADIQMLFGFARDATTHKLLSRWTAPLGTMRPTKFPPGPDWRQVADDD